MTSAGEGGTYMVCFQTWSKEDAEKPTVAILFNADEAWLSADKSGDAENFVQILTALEAKHPGIGKAFGNLMDVAGMTEPQLRLVSPPEGANTALDPPQGES